MAEDLGDMGSVVVQITAEYGDIKDAMEEVGKIVSTGAGGIGGKIGGIASSLKAIKGAAIFTAVAKGAEMLKEGFGFLLEHSQVLNAIWGGFMDIFGGILDIIMSAVMPAVQPLLDVMIEMIPVVQEVAEAFRPVFEWIGEIIKQLVTEFKPELKLIMQILVAILASGILVFFVALSAAIVAVGLVIRPLRIFFEWLWGIFTNPPDFGAIGRAMWEGIKAGINLIIGGVEWFLNLVPDAVNSLDILNKIPDLPHITLPRLQFGKLITEPTVALLGEAGPEIAMTPRQLARHTEGAGGEGVETTQPPPISITIQNLHMNSSDSQRAAYDFATRVAEELRRRYGYAVNTTR